jgi:6-phosphogluconate dehydrogenase
MLEEANALGRGDIILDGGSKHYRNTERRQKCLMEQGVSCMVMGVSGRYQSARRGPSMSSGGGKMPVEMVLPLSGNLRLSGPTVTEMGDHVWGILVLVERGIS